MTGTTYDRLEYLKETKRQIKEAIVDKGQTISDSDPFRSYVDKISAINTVNNQDKNVTPGANEQEITFDAGYTGLGTVTVAGDADLVASNIKSGVTIFGVVGNVQVPTLQQLKNRTISASDSLPVTIVPSSGYDAMEEVSVGEIENLSAENIKLGVEIAGVTGNYSGTVVNNQNKSIVSDGSYTADQGYTGLGTVTVTAGAVAAQQVENEMSEQLMLINDGEVELTVTVSPTDANLTITSVENTIDITPTSSSSGVYTFDISSLSTRTYTYSASATGYTTATGTIAGGTTTSTITLVVENNSGSGGLPGEGEMLDPGSGGGSVPDGPGEAM